MEGLMGVPTDMWEKMAPEQRQAALSRVLRLGTLGEKSDILKEQIAQAVGQQKPSGHQGYGLWGGLLTGLGDGLNQVAGVMSENRHRGELDSILPQQQAGREALGQQIIGGMGGQQADTGAPISSAPQSLNPAPPSLQNPQQQQPGATLPPWLMSVMGR